MSREVEATIDRIAKAFDPSSWKRSSLVVVSIVFAAVAALTVVQRALVADSTVGWAITAVHGLVVAVGVPLLIRRGWRDWRAARP